MPADPRLKTAQLNLRVEPRVKTAAVKAAKLDRRSLTSFVEGLILEYCANRGTDISGLEEKGKGMKASTSRQSSRVAAPAATESTEVHFYRANEKPYGPFSNLYRRRIVFEGREYPTAEHAYQAGKPRKDAVRQWILSAPTPGLVAMAAHGLYTWDIVSDWSTIKKVRMRDVLRAKFTRHPDLGELLLSTQDMRLVEAGRVNSAVNRFWGEVNGKGNNTLGVLLMEIREELRKGVGAGSPRLRAAEQTEPSTDKSDPHVARTLRMRHS